MGRLRALGVRRSGWSRWRAVVAVAAVVAGLMAPCGAAAAATGRPAGLARSLPAWPSAAEVPPAAGPAPADAGPRVVPPSASPARVAPTAPGPSVAAILAAERGPLLLASEPAATAGTYTLSSAVYQFLTGALHVPLSGPTLTGTLAGSTLTVATAPIGALPLASGVATPALGPVTIAIDATAKTLTLTAAVTVAAGAGPPSGTLAVTIADPGSATLAGTAGVTGTLTVAGVPFIGNATATLTGTLGHSGGALTASLTGSTQGAAGFDDGTVTIEQGATVSLARGGPFTVDGTADIGPAAGPGFTVAVAGSLTSRTAWSLTVSAAVTAGPWTPVPTLTLNPSFSGTITDQSGAVGVNLTAGQAGGGSLLTWDPDSGSPDPAMTVDTLQVSNAAPDAADVYRCDGQVTGGQLWIGAGGTFSDAQAGMSLTAVACVDATTRRFRIATTETGTPSAGLFGTGPGAPFTIQDAALTAIYDGTTFELDGSADLTVNGTGSVQGFQASIGLVFAANGTVVGAATVTSPAAMDDAGSGQSAPLPNQELVVFVASKTVTDFEPGDYSLPGPDFPASVPLRQGVTIAFDGTVPGGISGDFGAIGVTVPSSLRVLAAASLTTTGFAFNFGITFGTEAAGLELASSNGTAAYFDDVNFGLNLGTTTSFSVTGDAYVELPALMPGTAGSHTDVAVSGALDADGNVNLQLRLSNWQNALGIADLTVGTFDFGFGFDVDTLTPTFTLIADDVQFPASWNSALGLAGQATVSADANLDPANPFIGFTVADPAGQSGQTVLYPLAVAYGGVGQAEANPRDDQVINSLTVAAAEIYLAPNGGTIPGGVILQPGINVAFTATIAGESLSIQGSVQVSPSPSLSVKIQAAPLTLGQLSLGDTQFSLDAGPEDNPPVSLGFTGAVTDTAAYDGGSQLSFAATLSLALGSTSLNDASLSLTMTTGLLPSYLLLTGSLTGTVEEDDGQVSFSAAGSGVLTYENPVNGSVGTLAGATFSVNQDSDGFNWGSNATFSQIVAFFANAPGSVSTTEQILQHLGQDPEQVLDDLGLGGVSGPQVLSELTSFFGAFSNNYDALWVDPSPLDLFFFFDVTVPDGSLAAGAPVADAALQDADYYQQWEFFPASSGTYEIVNRGSGQCLTVTSPVEGTDVAQYPCTGSSTQQWRLSDGALKAGPRFTIQNVYSGYYLDVAGASPDEGAHLDQWQGNGGINQEFWITAGTNK